MSDIVIRADRLSKQYHIGARQPGYRTLRETLMDAFSTPVRKAARLLRGQSSAAAGLGEVIWALKDVSLEVKRGEVVGVIGRNGAGKSTLLKILCRITEPTEGEAEIHGRVGSLLEVGTGFHPELTGRENVYLNGAILGMKKAEIDHRFDEIVGFAGIDKFLDTPVKHYSSGMYVRLAFSVAAHLEPEIMLVDEVLAVGDVMFQKKCLGKMGDVAQEGRTVLFVSHNMSAIGELCSRAVLLQDASIAAEGEPRQVIDCYLESGADLMRVPIGERLDRTGSGRLRFTGVRVLSEGEETRCLECGREAVFEIRFQARDSILARGIRFAVSVSTLTGLKLISFDSAFAGFTADHIGGSGMLRCRVPRFPLVRGRYVGLLYAEINGVVADRLPDAFEFEVVSGKYPAVGWFATDQVWSLEQPV